MDLSQDGANITANISEKQVNRNKYYGIVKATTLLLKAP